jgi:hypothetical protein
MRFTPEILRKHAQVLVDKETKNNRSILAAYLRGSLLYGSPLIGGAGDIDLVFVHSAPPLDEYQIIPLTPEIHFDIEHHDELLYRTPRELRLDPWLGPALRDAVPLHDPRHLLDYTQASVRSNYDFPENIQARSNPLLEKARQFWMDRQISPPLQITAEFPAFLSALESAANAVAIISGPPLATRRLGLSFADRAAAVDAPGLAIAFQHLLGGITLPQGTLHDWIAEWENALSVLRAESSSPPLLTEREVYFKNALDDIIRNSKPEKALWPLLVTWTEIISALPERTDLQLPWIKALTTLGFAGKDYFVRLAAFDSFLELCESIVNGDSAYGRNS